jgi:tRNA pseudouridine65 synthase
MNQPLTILWRDPHLVAVYKPAGWLVHRTGLDAHASRFVLQTLRDQLGQAVWPVHRLDRGTCGVLLMALHSEAARGLGQAFAEGAVDKTYLAMTRGWLARACTVDHALRPDDAPADAPPQSARTAFIPLARLAMPGSVDPNFDTMRACLVEARPVTGRRHQIRRHLKHLAHPIIGDATHGKGPVNRWWAGMLGVQRLWLHAQSLAFTHPVTGERVQVYSGLSAPGQRPHADGCGAPVPPDWQALFDLSWAPLPDGPDNAAP